MRKNSRFPKMLYSSLWALELGKIGEGEGFGKFSLDKVTDVPGAIASFVSLFIGFITVIAGIWFGIKFILGAFAWISAGGNPESLKKARQSLVDALIGILVVVAALAVISIVGTVLGFPILDIGQLFKNIGIAGGTTP